MNKIDTIKVFISYAKEDRDIAGRLYNYLKGCGVSPWMDEYSLQVGQKWEPEISKAIKDSNFFIALLSTNSISKRGYVQKELKIAFDILDEFPSEDIFVLPVRIDNCMPIDERLQNLQWGDLFPDFEKSLTKILSVILGKSKGFPYTDWEPISPAQPLSVIAVMGTKGGVGKGTFVSFASQLLSVGGNDVAIIDLDLASSGTTLSAETDYGEMKPDSVLTVFDHFARKAVNIAPYSAGETLELWDITPNFLKLIGGGHIWLIPARDLSSPTGQSFDVIANILPPEKREDKLAKIIQELLDRICNNNCR